MVCMHLHVFQGYRGCGIVKDRQEYEWRKNCCWTWYSPEESIMLVGYILSVGIGIELDPVQVTQSESK